MITTTLNKIRAHSPCQPSWARLLESLGKTAADDEPLPMGHILDTLGIDDCLWAARTLPEHSTIWRLFAADCAEQVLPMFERVRPDDNRPRLAIEAARRHARREMADDELGAAVDAAVDAAWAAAGDAARDAAVDAAWAAAGDAARDAARDAAWAAAGDAARAAWDAASAAVSAAVSAAARDAASAAVSAAASAAARDAASAAVSAAASAAAKSWQYARLRQYLSGESTDNAASDGGEGEKP